MCCKTSYETRLKFALASAGMALTLTLLAVVEQHGLQVLACVTSRANFEYAAHPIRG